jgi:hypothetical protein
MVHTDTEKVFGLHFTANKALIKGSEADIPKDASQADRDLAIRRAVLTIDSRDVVDLVTVGDVDPHVAKEVYGVNVVGDVVEGKKEIVIFGSGASTRLPLGSGRLRARHPDAGRQRSITDVTITRRATPRSERPR